MKIGLLNSIKILIIGLIFCFSCSTIKNVEDEKTGKILNEKKLLDSIKSNEINPNWIHPILKVNVLDILKNLDKQKLKEASI